MCTSRHRGSGACRCVEPHIDQMQHAPVRDPARNRFEKSAGRIESKTCQIAFYTLRMTGLIRTCTEHKVLFQTTRWRWPALGTCGSGS
jgi:hypothetical protein